MRVLCILVDDGQEKVIESQSSECSHHFCLILFCSKLPKAYKKLTNYSFACKNSSWYKNTFVLHTHTHAYNSILFPIHIRPIWNRSKFLFIRKGIRSNKKVMPVNVYFLHISIFVDIHTITRKKFVRNIIYFGALKSRDIFRNMLLYILYVHVYSGLFWKNRLRLWNM